MKNAADKSGKKEEDFAQIVSAYTSRFGKNDDQTTVTEEERKKRQETAAEVADSYYNFATSAYENGWSQHFHYTPFAPDDTIHSAMCFYAHRLALVMGLRPGMKVLDVGCGIGGPAREIAKFVKCEIVGISINQMQIDRAIQLTAEAGLSDKCTFIQGNFLDLPFAAASFDAAYAVEATAHAPSLHQVYTNIAHVLKPGAVFGSCEWVLTSSFDATDPRHIGIRNRLERGNAVSNLHTIAEAREDMAATGFEIFHDEDYVAHFDHLKTRTTTPEGGEIGSSPVLIPFKDTAGGRESTAPNFRRAPMPRAGFQHPPLPLPQAYRPWWWPLTGQTGLATTWADYWTAWKMTMFARRACYALMWTLERVGVVDRGICEAMTTLAYCVDSTVEGAQEGIFSPSWWIIARKKDGEAVDDDELEAVSGQTAAAAAGVKGRKAWNSGRDRAEA